jgi:hypothetical protein
MFGWILEYCHGANTRIRIGWTTQGDVWGLFYPGEQCVVHFGSETKVRGVSMIEDTQVQ